MKSRPALPMLLAIGLMALLSACGATPKRSGIPWWPQEPGDAVVSETRAEREADAAIKSTPATHVSSTSASISDAQPLASAAAGALPGSYTQAIAYRDLLFLSGQIADDLETPESDHPAAIVSETHAVLSKIGRILQGHGLSMQDVIQTTVYLRNINDLPEMNAAYEEHFTARLPARTVVAVAGLPRGARLEISVVAGR